ncbi:MAG: response regulator [Pseudomonadota bacterium]
MKDYKKILVVDDDKSILLFFENFLTAQNYEVLTASDGNEALQKYSESGADLVISDMIMEGMTGIELFDKLQTFDQEIMFLLLTGYPSIDTAVQSIKKGVYDYITKPFNIDDLKMRIERALEMQSLKRRLKKTRGLIFGLMFSIPLWLFLGFVLTLFFYKK